MLILLTLDAEETKGGGMAPTLCASATSASGAARFPAVCSSWCCFTARRGALSGGWFALLRHHRWRCAGWNREVERYVERGRFVASMGVADRESREECVRAVVVLMRVRSRTNAVAGARRGRDRYEASQQSQRAEMTTNSNSALSSRRQRCCRGRIELTASVYGCLAVPSTRAGGQSRPALSPAQIR